MLGLIYALPVIFTVLGVTALAVALDDDDDSNTAQEDLSAETEDQRLRGEDTADLIDGSTGDDVLLGEGGADVLDGGAGDDRIEGGAGADMLEGGTGADTLIGGAGEDGLLGDAGDDELRGGDDDDVLIGGLGADLLRGGDGDDIIIASENLNPVLLDATDPSTIDDMSAGSLFLFTETDAEGDTVEGGPGQDAIFLGSNDTAKGGADVDLFILGEWVDSNNPATITDFNANTESIVFIHDNAPPTITTNVDADGNGTVFANGVPVVTVPGVGADFDAGDVTLVQA